MDMVVANNINHGSYVAAISDLDLEPLISDGSDGWSWLLESG